ERACGAGTTAGDRAPAPTDERPRGDPPDVRQAALPRGAAGGERSRAPVPGSGALLRRTGRADAAGRLPPRFREARAWIERLRHHGLPERRAPSPGDHLGGDEPEGRRTASLQLAPPPELPAARSHRPPDRRARPAAGLRGAVVSEGGDRWAHL